MRATHDLGPAPAGDANATERRFSALFRSFARDLRRFLLRKTQDPDIADELTQEAFLRLLRDRDVEALAEPKAFLFRVAGNLAIDRARTQRRRPVTASIATDGTIDGQDAGADGSDPERALIARQNLALVLSALDTLPPACRTAFVLFRFDGASQAEIAVALGISKSMVQKHVAAAMERLRAALQEETFEALDCGDGPVAREKT